jgi:aminoglycoside phosphotransferase family enzyme/predicted kinase
MGIGLATDSMELVETCFARIYRTPTEVFKLRDPVELRLGRDRIDLSSVEQRRAACLEEEDLDRRLAPDVPIGVVPLTRDSDGRERFVGNGEPIDWALRMRRLPDIARADHRLETGTLTDAHLHEVARRLAAFHARARRDHGGARQPDPVAALRGRIELRIEMPDGPRQTPLPREVERLEAWQLDFLRAEADRFRRRARSDSIREGHGELALEHIFLDDSGEVRILAGLEMNPPLRHADVTADVALLASDLGARHRVDLAERFVAEYASIANDFDLYPLLDFYSSLQATLRGKLAWLCADRSRRQPRRAETRREHAQRLFKLGLAAPRRPLLPAAVVAMGGQVASGKSTLATRIARRIGAPVVRSDATRDDLLGVREDEPLHEARWAEAYAPDFGNRVYEEVLRRAAEVVTSGRPVVIDGCFRSTEQRARARALAERFGRPFLFVEARVSRGLQLERLAERAARDRVPLSDWRAIADQLRVDWEPADELPESERLGLDTSLPLDRNAASIEARLPTWPEALEG